ncbi:hypothetical protein C3L33_08920, partial [Rhododendron williamsianum]
MDEEVKSKKSRETGTFTGEAWKRIMSELIRLTGLINLRGNSKKKGMPYYHELCRVFGDTSTTGAHAHPSNKVPSSSDSSDPEFQFKDEPEVESAEGSKAKPKAKNKKRDSFSKHFNGVSGSMSIREVGIGPLTAEMKECQALLNTMDDLDEDSYKKVLEKLHGDVLWRQMFMDMSEKRRIAWIKKL